MMRLSTLALACFIVYSLTAVEAKAEALRGRRQVLVGGASESDVNSESIKKIAAFGVKAVNARSESNSNLELVNIEKAYTQVVAGLKYYIRVNLSPSACSNHASNCKADSSPRRCDLVVVEQSWLDKIELIDWSCDKDLMPKHH